MYLLDTNTLIYFFKGEGNVAKNLFSQTPSSIAISSLVLYQLEVGIAKSSLPQKRLLQLNTLLENIRMIDFTPFEAKTSAQIRAKLESIGEPIGTMDTLIAGCALAHNLTLITHNTKEFKKVKGLKIQDWFI